MRVTADNQHQSERPARGALLAVLFGLLIIGLIVAYGATGRSGSSIEAVSSIISDQAESLENRRALNIAAGPVRSTTTVSVAESRSRVYEDGIGGLEGEIVQFEQRVLSVAPVTVPPPPTTQAPTTTVATPEDAPEAAEETTTSTEDPNSTDTTDTTGPDSTDTTDTTTGSDTTDTTVEEQPTTTTTTPAPAPTTHPDGWVDAGHGIFVPPVLLSIRFCESRDNYTAANPSSSARGAYQFLTGSWAAYGHKDRYGVNQAHLASPAQQDEAALITWQRDGTRPWNASRHCWS